MDGNSSLWMRLGDAEMELLIARDALQRLSTLQSCGGLADVGDDGTSFSVFADGILSRLDSVVNTINECQALAR